MNEIGPALGEDPSQQSFDTRTTKQKNLSLFGHPKPGGRAWAVGGGGGVVVPSD